MSCSRQEEDITRAGYSILFAHPIKYALVLRYSKKSDVGISVTNWMHATWRSASILFVPLISGGW